MIATTWADDLAVRAESVDPHTRDKARFYLRQISSALAPSNFVATNPELLHETISSNAENLLRGLGFLAHDMEAGKGTLRIRQTDVSKFELGKNVAATPGKVIFRNDLIELIQYAPSTETVFRRPLLIVPPWINKFYILDLNPDKSFARWAVAQEQTVFMISWVNAETRHRDKDWNAYMREGIFAGLEAIEQATGERDVNAIGYCVGGTLLSATLAYMAETQDERIKSATFFAAQTDFSEAGDLKVYIDEEQLASLEACMQETGYLDGSKMASAFNMLRPNDLIWPYIVNNYLKGQQPAAFDLLAWNSDSTRIPAANHAFYLRCCYLENRLAKGEMELDGKKLSLGKVTIPIYSIATQEDHIAPARSVFNGVKLFGGDVRYVLGGSGHIAGIINPPAKAKYQYWLGPKPDGTFDEWRAAVTEHPGSWWLDWIEWLRSQASEKVPARAPGDGKLAPLCDAPGDYVRVKI
jgi:polyhydroxyalkanoate synthase